MGSSIESPVNGGLGDFLTAHRGEKHLIVLQNYPDPDAISSAFAYQLIADRCSIRSDILYSGRISHQQNIALVKLIRLNMTTFTPSFSFAGYDGAVFVDNQGTTSTAIVDSLRNAGIPPLVIVDHHEVQGFLEAEFTDIRRTGATATIFAEYLRRGMLDMDRQNKEHLLLATALLHGIMTDTGDFVRANYDDLKAASYLSRFRDAELLLQIVNQARSRKVMEIIHRAIINRMTIENYSIAGIGYLRGEHRDVIPQAADFLLTEENIHTAIVYGIVTNGDRDEKLVGSLRTSKSTLDPDEFLKNLLGKDDRGHYWGGGKESAGGFEIPIGFLSGGEIEAYQNLKWQVYDNQIKQRVLTKIGGHQPSG